MHIAVLGPLRVCIDGEESGIRSVRRRNLLAALTASVGRIVPTTRLSEALWGDDPPASAHAALQVHLSDLRSTLEPDRPPREEGSFVATVPEGYRLSLRTGQLDSTRFEHLARGGRRLRSEGRAADAELVLGEALRSWRGEAYGDCAEVAPDHVRWLEELRDDVEDDRFAAALAAGGAERVVGDLQVAADLRPFRERRAALQMLALYRVGRQRDALAAYEVIRERLLEQLGCDPGPELATLHRAILQQAPALDTLTLSPPPPGPGPAVPRRRDAAVLVRGDQAGVALAEALLHGVGVVARRGPGEAVVVGDAARLGEAVADELALEGTPLSGVALVWSEDDEVGRDGPVVASRPAPVADAAASAWSSSLVARDQDLAQVLDLLERARVVTVVGPPGVGKSALAQDVERRLGERVVAVDVGPSASISDVEQAVRDRLGLAEHPLRDPTRELRRALRGRVLVLDGCDRLRLEVAAWAPEVAGEGAEVTVLVTARRRLGVAGEQVVDLRPLAVPTEGDEPEEVLAAPAVALLVARAGLPLGDADPAALAALATRLDGLPLALELAAPALRSLGPAVLVDRLDRSSGLLAGDGADLHEVISASYEWLGDDARLVLDRASVFAAPFSLDDLEAVVTDEHLAVQEVAVGLSELVEASLVEAEAQADGLVYRLLRVVRRVAADRLAASGGAAAVQDRHAAHVASVLGRAGLSIAGRGGLRGRRRVERSLADLRATLDRYRRHDRVDEQLLLAGRLGFFWFASGRIGEGRRICGDALAAGGSPSARAGCLAAAAFLAWWQGDYDAVAAHLDECLSLPDSLQGQPMQRVAEASLAWTDGDVDAAERHIGDALEAAQRSGKDWELAVAASIAGNVAWYRGEHAVAVERYRRAADVGRWIGNDLVLGLARRGEALNLALDGRLAEASQGVEEAMVAAEALGDPLNEGQARTFAGLVALEAGEDERAASLLVAGVARSAAAMDVMGLVLGGAGLLEVAARADEHERVGVLDGWLDGAVALTRLPLPPRERARREAAGAGARARLGDAGLASARERGRAMTPDRLVAYVTGP